MVQISLADLGLRAFDANGFTVSGALCYVYDAGTTTPVTTYSDNGLTTPQTFPVPANANGAFPEIYVPVGVYKVDLTDDEGASLPGFPKDYLPIPFSAYAVTARTREEVAARALQLEDGAIIWLGTLPFQVQDGATVISDIANVVPAGDVYPDHFAENATPGTTNMTAAINSAADYVIFLTGETTDYGATPTAEVHFMAGSTYYLASTFILEEGKSAIHFVGHGARLVTDNSNPMIRINESYITLGGDVAGSTFVSGTKFTDFTFQNTNVASTSSRCITAGKANDWYIERCHFIDFYTTLDLHRSSNLRLNNSRFWLKSKTGSARTFVRFQGVNEGGDTLPGGGNFIQQCEFIGLASDHTLLSSCIEVNSSDGLYVDFCHLIRAQSEFLIAPDGTTQNNKVTDIKVAQCYMDGVCDRNVQITGSVAGAGNGLYQDIEFDQCLFRAGFIGAYGILMSVTDAGGFVSSQGGIEGLKINACKFRQHNTAAISVAGASTSKVPVIGMHIQNSDFRENDGATNVISLDCTSVMVSGNEFGAESSAPGRTVLVNLTDAEEQSAIISGNDFSRSTYSQRAWEVTGLSTDNLSVFGNILAGGNGVSIDQTYTALTSNYSANQIFTYDFSGNNQAVTLNTEIVGTDTSGGNNYFQYEYRVLARRNASGTSAVVAKTQVVGVDTISNNQRPVDVVMLNGTAWSAQTYTVGDLVTNAGNVYLVITVTGASATAPTHTSGAALLDGTTRFLYLGAINANRLALIVSAENTMSVRWAAHVSAKGTS